MAGNLLLFVGPDAYNAYGHALVSMKIIYLVEAALVGLFVLHFALAMKLTLENRRARPVAYHGSPNGGRAGSSLASRSMILSGAVLLVFTVLHLITFKFGTVYTTTVDGVEMRDLYQLVQETFQQPTYVAWYVFSLLVLWAHLAHGVSSAFQTFGWNHPAYWTPVRKGGALLAALIALGFMTTPIFLFYRG